MATLQHPESFVRWFRQVAPYLHAFRGRTFVVAFGGEMFAERARFASFIHDVNILAALGIRLVLVHGARPQIEAELKARGIRSHYAHGLRITDERALQAVKEAAGVLRVEIEAAAVAGVAELADGRRANPRRVGELHHRAAHRRGERHRFPVHRSGTQGRRRRRSRAASTLARWRSCRRSAIRPPARCSTSRGKTSRRASPWRSGPTSCSCTPTGFRPIAKGEVIAELTAQEAEALLSKKTDLSATTKRAMEHAVRAVKAGVARSHIVTRRASGSLLLELFTHTGVGTMITAATVEKLRPARIEDVRRHARA